MIVEHRDWRPAYDAREAAWRVARTDASGREVYGASATGDGTPYRCCCEDRAASMSRAMNTAGHP